MGDAILRGLVIGARARRIAAIPMLSEVNKRATFGYYAAAAASRLVRNTVSWWRGSGIPEANDEVACAPRHA
jgi:hypothetical protein